ncbi:MAG: hypothetical protein HOV80_19110 [Polyangiaceae bacterium]|nr:hypothetical protein [Polyangiaceae bacterium]
MVAVRLERALLERHVEAYGRYFGRAPTISIEYDDTFVTFPAHSEPEYRSMIARVDELGTHPAVRDYVKRLGFGWTDDSIFSTIPSPATFERRRAREGMGETGFSPKLYELSRLAIAKGEWLSACVRGFVPYAVGTKELYERLSRTARQLLPRARSAERYFLWGVQHDMTRHGLFTHLVPERCVKRFGERIGEHLANRRPLLSPTPLLRFYENDLTQYCQSVWRDLPAPHRFAAAFEAPAGYSRLEATLDRRLEEAHRPSVTWLFV